VRYFIRGNHDNDDGSGAFEVSETRHDTPEAAFAEGDAWLDSPDGTYCWYGGEHVFKPYDSGISRRANGWYFDVIVER
jgi:hypothetical protein